MNNKKEYAIGDTVQMGLLTLVCVEQNFNENCKDCTLYGLNDADRYLDQCLRYVGSCIGLNRTDNKNVIFKLKDD